MRRCDFENEIVWYLDQGRRFWEVVLNIRLEDMKVREWNGIGWSMERRKERGSRECENVSRETKEGKMKEVEKVREEKRRG